MSRRRGGLGDFRGYAAGILTEVGFIVGILAAGVAIILILRFLVG